RTRTIKQSSSGWVTVMERSEISRSLRSTPVQFQLRSEISIGTDFPIWLPRMAVRSPHCWPIPPPSGKESTTPRTVRDHPGGFRGFGEDVAAPGLLAGRPRHRGLSSLGAAFDAPEFAKLLWDDRNPDPRREFDTIDRKKVYRSSDCESAPKVDPESAFNCDPSWRR